MISQELLNSLQKEFSEKQTFPKEEKKLKSYLGDYQELFEISDAIIAGGSITSLFTNSEINDIDVYFRDAQRLSNFLALVFSQECGWLKLMHMTDRSVLLSDHHGLKIQLIVYKFFETPQDVFNAFDFSVNMGAYDFKERNFVLDPRFLRHNAQRYLEVNTNTDYPLISVLRVDKYREKGYRISKPQMLALLMAVSSLKLDSWEQAQDQFSGMYGVDPDKLFDKTKDFSVQEVISQLQSLETVDGKFIPNDPTFKNLSEKLSGKISFGLKTILEEFKWDTSKFLDLLPDVEVEEEELPVVQRYRSQSVNPTLITIIDDMNGLIEG